MGIRVQCPKGHVFKVKDKYAGKKGLCPHCPGQVVVVVPSALGSDQADKAYRSAVADEVRHQQVAASAQAASVLDETLHDDASSSGSLLSSSVVRHNVRCSCGQSVPMWFARCPGCGKYMENR
jgi:hypothetical protein